jgi:P4 family phage/plasmid primase-like protien
VNLADIQRVLPQPVDRTFATALYASVSSTRPEEHALRASDLVQLLTTHSAAPQKDEVGLFAPHQLAPGCARRNEHVQAISAGVLDIDKGNAVPEEVKHRIELAGYEAVMYSTWSHTVEAPAFRVVVPYREDITPLRHVQVWDALNQTVAGGAADPATKDPARMYYLPSHPVGSEHMAFAWHLPGNLLDPSTLLPASDALEAATRANADLVTVLPARPYQPEVARQMLSCIDPDEAYRVWITVLMCLAQWSDGQARTLAEEWSKGALHRRVSAKYDPGAFEKQWKTVCKRISAVERRIGFSTLEGIATEHGWRPQATEGGTDLANARLFAATFYDSLRYLHGSDKWMRWTGNRWSWCEAGEEVNAAKQVADALADKASRALKEGSDAAKRLFSEARYAQSRRGLEAMLAVASSESTLSVTPEQLDADPWLLGVQNGVVDLRSGTLRAADQRPLLTKQCSARFEGHARCPRWQEFLDQIFEGDCQTIAYIQRALGYSLTGTVVEEVLFFCFGFGANGKSVFANVVADVLGDYCVTAPPSLLVRRREGDVSPRNDIARLRGARVVLANETQDGERLDAVALKTLVSRERVAARFLHKEYFEFMPTFKVWVRGNHKPIITEDDDGTWRRLHLIPFDRRFNEHERNPNLEQELLVERDGILGWMIEGALQWGANGLKRSVRVTQASNEYRSDSDVLGEYLESAADPNTRTLQADLFEDYRRFCDQNGVRCPSKNHFTRKLAERGVDVQKSGDKRYYVGARAWVSPRFMYM